MALGEAVGRIYVAEHFPPRAKARMQEMVRNILLAMHDTIDGLDWMAPATKTAAVARAATRRLNHNGNQSMPDSVPMIGLNNYNGQCFGSNAQ